MKKHLNKLQRSKSEYEEHCLQDKEECARLKKKEVKISLLVLLQDLLNDMIPRTRRLIQISYHSSY
jgi:hypothetical protein